MDDFDRMWQLSYTNSWSFAYPLVIGIGIALLIGLSSIRNTWRRRFLKCCSILILTGAACEAASRQIELKWKTRFEYMIAHSEQLSEDQKTAVIGDGANRVLGPLIYGFQGFLIFVVTVFIIRVYFPMRATTSNVAGNGLVDRSEVLSSKPPSNLNEGQPIPPA